MELLSVRWQTITDTGIKSKRHEASLQDTDGAKVTTPALRIIAVTPRPVLLSAEGKDHIERTARDAIVQ
ncbi:hypothetical protein [Streptomyces sp. AcE210]|uniref:hypothetical protein n=1 Tax=Streptomyces sp. AcE210 TaxID=2292703 RepID=UPI000E30AD2E|nr:hypothetical protein [Streptomyces sp. AcE210]RFC75186.1 hypothetical protein DXZ75_19525 [Streptomyces sp. AcE210]